MAKKSAAVKRAKPAPEPVEQLQTGVAAMAGVVTMKVAFGDLVLDELNVRKNHQVDKGMVASLAAHGLLNPLLVKANGEGKWAILGGGRRYTNIKYGRESGAFAKGLFDYVECREVNDAHQAREISLADNLHQAMHPLDTCEAILELAKTEEDENAIAARFGQSVTWIKQRVALANLSDKAKEAYRANRMDLLTAGLMTRLTEKEQDKLCKGTHRIDDWSVRRVIEQRSIPADVAIFDWVKEYPADKIQRSLFEDIGVMLLDPGLFLEMQEKAIEQKIRELADEGYNVERLKDEDYTTLGKYVEFEGKPKAEEKPSLHIFVKMQRGGEVRFSKPMISRKQASDVKKGAKGKADKTDTAPVVLKATELTAAQHQILTAHLVKHRRMAMTTGKGISQGEIMWFAIKNLLHVAQQYSGGPDKRWAELKKDYAGEFDDIEPKDDRADVETLTEEKFLKLKPDDRLAAFNKAVAACLVSPYGGSVKTNASAFGTWRIVPGEAFFKRYRVDQLQDYLKRSGFPESSGKWPIKRSKGEFVKAAMWAAQQPTAWQFGLNK